MDRLSFFALYKSTNQNLLSSTTTKPSAVANQISTCITAFLMLWGHGNLLSLTCRAGILFYFPYTVHELWSYPIVLCFHTIGMIKTLHNPLIIHSSNRSDEWSLYLAGEAVCAVESTLPYFLGSLVFQMEGINCMACWWAPEMPFLFWFKAKRPLSLRLQRTPCSVSQKIGKISELPSQICVVVFIFDCWRRLKGLFFYWA